MRLLGHPGRTWSIITTGLLLTLGLMLGSSRALAQETTTAPHPAHIHNGTCTELGDVVYPLTDVTTEVATIATPGAGEMTGSPESAAMESASHSMEGMASPTGEMAMSTPVTAASPRGHSGSSSKPAKPSSRHRWPI